MNQAEYAADHGLLKVGARPPFGSYFGQVWQRRDFIYSLARFKIESENQRNRLGMGWVILKPLINALVYGLVFGLLLAGTRPDNFVPFLIIGVFFWEFFSSSFGSGTSSITSNQALVQSLAFPRMALPISAVTYRFLQFLPVLPILFILLVLFGERPRWTWFGIIPLVLLYYLFNAGVAFFMARLTVHFRDLNQLLPFVTRMLFYTTGIFFSVDKTLANHDTLRRIYDFHPIHEVLSLARGLLLNSPEYPVDKVYWLYLSLWAIGLFAIGSRYFWAAEEKYGRDN